MVNTIIAQRAGYGIIEIESKGLISCSVMPSEDVFDDLQKKMTIQKILTKFEPKRENLLGAAKEINKELGHVSAQAVEALAKYFGMKPAAIYSAVSFYDHINTKAPASLMIRICDGANCSEKHSEQIIEEIEHFFGLREGDEFNPKVRIQRESCLGLCEVGPVMVVNGTVFERVVPGRVAEILKGYV